MRSRAGICPGCGEHRLLFVVPITVTPGTAGAERMGYRCRECAWPDVDEGDEHEYVPEGWFPHD